MRKPVPVKQTEDLTPQGKDLPEGAWQGTIEEVNVRNLPDVMIGDDPSVRGFSSNDVETVSLQIGGLQPMEGQDEVGNSKFFTPDIVLRDGEYNLEDEDIPEQYWQIAERSYKAFVNLAAALGFVDVVDLDGEEAYLPQDEFLDLLREGNLKGQKIGFVVSHRSYKKKDGSKGTAVEVKTYLPAV